MTTIIIRISGCSQFLSALVRDNLAILESCSRRGECANIAQLRLPTPINLNSCDACRVAGELLHRAGVTMFHFVENLQPYQFAKDTYRLSPNARIPGLRIYKDEYARPAMDERNGETVGLHKIPVSD